ncbi:MAG: TolC family protein [Prevotella sp.]|nr:TolC family protein [Prevotella sp.]
MNRLTPLLLALLSACAAGAQTWTARDCMAYAVEHNHQVKRATLSLDNDRAARTAAIGRFLPMVDAGIGAQYNFGRAIDPETNTYTDVSTFYNGYSLSASLPVFDGFGRVHALRAAKADVLTGKSALRAQQDQTALATLQAYADLLYYQGTLRMAEEHQQECDLLVRQTRLLEEVGRKSQADVAQMEAQQAEAAYEVTRQRNLLSSARLELKREMGFPLEDTLQTDSLERPNWEFEASKLSVCTLQTAALQQAYHQMQSSRHQWHQARASLYPTLSLGAGLSTTYYKQLHADYGTPFNSQLKNNMGQYVTLSLDIPLFNRLQTVTGIRRAKNNYLMAREAYEEKQAEMQKLCIEAHQDWQAYVRQTAQMERKLQADSLAYRLTRRQFEEGLSTAIDLRTTSVTLMQTRATLLQCRLMAMLKHELIRYYNGEQIWTEQ